MSQVKDLIDKIDDELMKKQYEATKEVIDIVGKFIKRKQLIIYGGFAINLLLSKKNKFYKEYTINDYDCFSSNAKEDAKELAQLLQSKGFQYIKIRKAIHESTFKVFVDFMAVIDITQIKQESFDSFKSISKQEQKTSLYKHYNDDYLLAPFSFLMSNMHYELARPLSSYYRWEKIYRRQSVLAKLIKTSKKDNTKNSLSQSYDKKLMKYVIDYIKNRKYAIINEFALKYHGFNNFDTNEISILSIDIDKTKKDFDSYMKTNSQNYKIIVEHNNVSNALIYDNYKFTIINKETDERIILNIMDASKDCLSIVSKKNINVGSMNTIMYFMYRKYLLQQISGNINPKLWENIKYIEYNVQEKMISNPKNLLSTTCYGINQSLKDMLASKWRKKQTLMYF